MTDTSSADPVKLRQYATDGMAMAGTLQLGAQGLRDAVDRFANAGGPVNGLADFASAFVELGADWHHLDEFAGDVADGFFACLMGGPTRNGGVVELADDVLAELGQVGYADRQEAIDAAEDAARRLEELLGDDDVSVEEIEVLLGDIAAGQYDPAFAVAFSEQLGVEGYVEAVGMIRESYRLGESDDQLDAALAGVQVLANTVTTALAGSVSDEFVHDLVGGYDPGNMTSGYEHTDLSVLVSMTDPPTDVAVQIASNRLSGPLYVNTVTDTDWSVDLAWGDRSDILTNYADMLGRNPDASAQWLELNPPDVPGGSNLNLVLHQEGDGFIDGGRALAEIVESAVTHPEIQVRQEVFEHAVTIVGAEGDVVDNAYMPDALAKGVEHNMPVVDRLVNSGWDRDGDGNFEHDGSPELAMTHEFLREVAQDDSAQRRINAAAIGYVDERIGELQPGEDGNRDRSEMHDAGRILEVTTDAQVEAAVHEFEEASSDAARRAALVNFCVGFVEPYRIGDANAVAEMFLGTSAGELLTNPPDGAELEAELRSLAIAFKAEVDGMDVSPRDRDAVKAGAFDTDVALT